MIFHDRWKLCEILISVSTNMVYWNPTTLIYVLSMVVFALQRDR